MRKRKAVRSKRLPKVGRPVKRARVIPRRVFGHVSIWASARIRRGITVRTLALIVGITPASISRIERGLQRPAPATVARMKRALR